MNCIIELNYYLHCLDILNLIIPYFKFITINLFYTAWGFGVLGFPHNFMPSWVICRLWSARLTPKTVIFWILCAGDAPNWIFERARSVRIVGFWARISHFWLLPHCFLMFFFGLPSQFYANLSHMPALECPYNPKTCDFFLNSVCGRCTKLNFWARALSPHSGILGSNFTFWVAPTLFFGCFEASLSILSQFESFLGIFGFFHR